MVMQPHPKVAGFGIHSGNSVLDLRQERAEVMEMLERHRLTVLNTWGRKTYTYKHPSGSSQIDYVVIRQQHADHVSKGCTTVKAPVAGWRTSGHEILQASIRQSWQPWKSENSPRKALSTTAPSLQKLQLDVQPSLGALQASLLQHHNVPSTKPPKPPLRNVDVEIRGIWRNLARARARFSRGPLSRLFGAWQLALLKCRARREIKRIARQRKRHQLLNVLELAESADAHHQSRDYYKYIRMIAPKTMSKKICLRDVNGQLQSPEQECQQLTSYVRSLFSGTRFELPQQEPLPLEWFIPSEWEWAFKQLQNHKAVPKGQASIQTWKLHSSEVAPVLQQVARNTVCSSTPCIPVEWSQVQLAWLPKPGKSTADPANLRTIGLMGGDTKAWLYILKKHANPFVQEALQDVPQYAYRAQASTADPLLRASQHCQQVRKMLDGCLDDRTSRLLQQKQPLLLGGMMVSLDLSKAFDSLTHEEMYLALTDTGMPSNLANVLVHIHIETQLHIVHKGHQQTVGMGRGLRQGCGVAPMIYAAWTCRLCKRISQELGQGWPQQHVSIYADDKHGFWQLRCPADLDKARRELGQLIQIITRLGMTVNSSKSRIVIALKGKLHLRKMQQITKQWNGQQCLMVPYEGSTLYIPVHSTLEYLGMRLGYGKFEVQAAQHRVLQANIAFNQLKAPLRTNGALSLCRRLRLYKTCVLPSMLYGIVSVGCSLEVVKVLSSAIARHMRKICRVHEKGVSNEQVLLRAGIDVYTDLHKRMEAQLRALKKDTARSSHLQSMELQRAESLQVAYQQLCRVASTRTDSHLLKNVVVEKEFPCPVCGVYFGTQLGLQQHVHQRHQDIELKARVDFDRSKHCLNGVPICKFCEQRLGDWQALRKHLTQGMCPAIKAEVASGGDAHKLLARIDQARVEPALDESQAEQPQDKPFAMQQHDVLRVPTHQVHHHFAVIRAHMSRCMLCGQRLANPGHIKTHWRTGHLEAWKLVAQSSATLAGSLSAVFQKPCQFCGSKAHNICAHSRQCPSFFQIMAVRQLISINFPQERYAYVQAAAPKQDKSNPQYKTYVAPIVLALRGTITDKNTTAATSNTGTGAFTSDTARSHSDSHTRVPRSQQDGTITCFFQHPARLSGPKPSVVEPISSGMSSPPAGPWQCRVQLRNQHNMCYINACFLSMTYSLGEAGISLAPLQNIVVMLQNAAARSLPVKLTQGNRFRMLIPHWVYDEAQKDSAEYLQQLLQAQRLHSVQWDARKFGLAGLQIRAQGDIPIPMPIPPQARDLQDVITHWNTCGDVQALAHESNCICIQLNRYLRLHQTYKLTTPIRFDRPVYMPRFIQHVRVAWDPYQVTSVVVHIGRHTNSGHYRALLRVEDQWMYTDDSVYATATAMSRDLESNVYVLWLKRC